MKKTDNYSLPQWEKQDFIKMEDFNDAFGKTGTGRSGSGNPTVIVTGFRPLVLVLTSKNGTFVRIRHTDATFADHDFTGGNVTNQMTWGADRISWYNTVSSSANERQANESGVTYYYLVLGCDAA